MKQQEFATRPLENFDRPDIVPMVCKTTEERQRRVFVAEVGELPEMDEEALVAGSGDLTETAACRKVEIESDVVAELLNREGMLLSGGIKIHLEESDDGTADGDEETRCDCCN